MNGLVPGGGGGGGGHISPRLNAIKYHLRLQSFAMTHYKSHDQRQHCFGKECVTNFEIGLGFAEIIAGLSLEVMSSRF